MVSLRIYSIIIFSALVLSCSGGSSVNTFEGSSDAESVLPSPATSDSFYVKLTKSTSKVNNFDYMLYKILSGSTSDFDFSDTCKVAKNGSANQDLTCVIDVNEKDIFYYPAQFEFVVPPGMCDYVEFGNYWHYNYEVGTGPTSIYIHQVLDANGVFQNADCIIDGVASADCSSVGNWTYDEASIDAEKGTATCVYDYSANGGDGPNCCVGTYALTVERETVGGATPGSTFTGPDVTDWGGSVEGGCVTGPAVSDTAWPKTSDGFPTGVFYPTRDEGVAIRYDLKTPYESFNNFDNQEIANWHAGILGDTRHTHHVGATTSILPILIDPIADRSGTLLPTAQDPYVFLCTDSAREILHRIRVYIREYDTTEAFDAFKASPVDGTQDTDKSGTEGGGGANDCLGFTGSACNDYNDLDDFLPSGDITTPYANQCGLLGTSSCYPSLEKTDVQ